MFYIGDDIMKRLVNIKFEEEQKGNKTNINMYNGYTYLGTVDLYKYSSDNLTWVGNLEIKPQFRGQGLGRTLFDYCLKKGANALCVAPDNTVAVNLYKSSGFECVGHNEGLDIYILNSAKPSQSFWHNLSKTEQVIYNCGYFKKFTIL